MHFSLSLIVIQRIFMATALNITQTCKISYCSAKAKWNSCTRPGDLESLGRSDQHDA